MIKDYLEKIKAYEQAATPSENWVFPGNVPFYVDMKKPAGSMSKHDLERPTYWRYEDGVFVANARRDVPRLVEMLENALLALEYQALVNHGYSYLAQAALEGRPLDEGQVAFLEWARTQPAPYRGGV